MKHVASISAIAAVVTLFAGCATHGYNQADSLNRYLQSTSSRTGKMVAQIDAATAALSSLVEKPGADLKLQFKNFSSALNGLESAAHDVASRSTKAQQLGASYFQLWDEQLARIQNEEIRSASADRKAAVMKQFEKARDRYDEARAAFNPLLADLRDIRTALSTDLNPAGVEVIRKSMSKVSEGTAAVRKSLVDAAAQFEELGKSLEVPAVPPPDKSEPAAK
jgi:hypothetical protein